MKTHRSMGGWSALVVMVIGIFVAGTVAPRAAAGQDTTQLSASLLRRLAEAVDGQRNNRAVWVVIQRQFPHDVKGVYYSSLQATEVSSRLVGYSVRGPFFTPPDSGTRTVLYAVDPCPGVHDSFSQCPDTTHPGTASAVATIPQEDVDSIVVTIYARRGPPLRRGFAGSSVDALFFTLPAIDKFVMPYYTRLYGPDLAAQMRSAYVRQITRAASH
jgi:hypothetical protein